MLAGIGVGLYDFTSKYKGKNFLWIVIYIYLILLIGLRFEVGGDTLTYMSWFEWAKPLSRWNPFDLENVFEPGFTFIVACVKEFGGEFYHFQIVHAIIINSCIFYFISKNTKYRFSSLLVGFLTYYIYFSTEILRESIAIFIFILNFKSFIYKKWIRYYIGIFFCIFFHLSSSFLLILPLLYKLKFDASYLKYIILFIFVCIFLQPLFSIIAEVAPVVGDKAEGYGRHSNVGYLWAGLRILQFSIIPLLTLIICKYIFHIKPKYEIAYLILIILGIGILFSPIIFQRFTNYFYPLLALSLADVICKNIRSKNHNKIYASILLTIVITFGYGSFYIYLDFYQRWIPYSSIYNPQSYSVRYKFYGGG